jgi:xanthine dehydrogenase molybdenum-binding subunit
VVGQRIPKYDGADKVTGKAIYADDIRLPRLLHGKILRSPLPHARILNIDVSRALRLPGVKAVITGEDTSQRPFGFGNDNWPLKRGKVRCVGDEVAAVAAISENLAKEALSLIKVDYEPIPAVFDPEEAMLPGAPLVHENRRSNISMTWRFSHGDVEQALREADCIVEERFSTQYVSACPIEPHTTVASFDASGYLTVWAGVHFATMYRKALAECLGIPWSKIRIIQPTIGGSFGSKIDIDPLDFICVLLAQRTGRPVKIVFTREEEFIASRPRQPMIFYVRAGAKRDGSLLAREVRVVSDNGAYNAWGGHALIGAVHAVTSLYQVPHVSFRGDVVYTNKPYGGAMRGFGNPQAAFAIESTMDMLAERLGMDPVEFRLRNANHPGEVTPQGQRVTSCGMVETIQAVSERMVREQTPRPATRGWGLACYTNVGGGARIYHSDGCGALVRIDEGGGVTLITGATDIGQGSDTVLAQIVAEELGVLLGDIHVVNADTSIKPWDVGSHASRTTFIAGKAALVAAARAKAHLLQEAAAKLEARAEDLEIRDGRVSVRGSPERSLTVAQIARAALLRPGGRIIMGEAFYDPDTQELDQNLRGHLTATVAFGTQAAEAEVDRETGEIRVRKVVAAHDVGRAINPMATEGQVEGGVLMGVGFGICEKLQVESGAIRNPNFLDYRIPTSADSPQMEVILVETVDPEGPYGAKGVGETGLIPTAAAIANAVWRATGVRVKDLPVTPEKILKGLEG